MTAKLRYTLAAIAGATSIALTGATASVVMSALQTAVQSDASVVTTAPETADVPVATVVEEAAPAQEQTAAPSTAPVEVSVAEFTDNSSPGDLVDLLPDTVRRYCGLAAATSGVPQACALGDLLSTAVASAALDR